MSVCSGSYVVEELLRARQEVVGLKTGVLE